MSGLTFRPLPLLHFSGTGSAAEAPATHIDDLLGCGECDALPKVREYLGRRFGDLKLRGSPFVYAGMGLAQECDFSVTLTRDENAQNPKPPPTTPQLRAARQKTL